MSADLTIVIPTQGRQTLPRCLESMLPEHHDGYKADVVVVIDTFEIDPVQARWVETVAMRAGVKCEYFDAGFHNWGYPQLQYGYDRATGDYIMNIGDDDVYEPGAFEIVRAVIAELDQPTPLLFRALMHPSVSRPCGNPLVLWGQRGLIRRSRVTGQNLVAPNVPEKLGQWVDDYIHLEQTVTLWDGLVEWREEVIARCF